MRILTKRAGGLAAVSATVALVAALALGACGSGGDEPEDGSSASFAELQSAAEGQTVRWWMFGGDARINAYVDDEVIPAAERLGIELERVPVTHGGSRRCARWRKVASERRHADRCTHRRDRGLHCVASRRRTRACRRHAHLRPDFTFRRCGFQYDPR